MYFLCVSPSLRCAGRFLWQVSVDRTGWNRRFTSGSSAAISRVSALIRSRHAGTGYLGERSGNHNHPEFIARGRPATDKCDSFVNGGTNP